MPEAGPPSLVLPALEYPAVLLNCPETCFFFCCCCLQCSTPVIQQQLHQKEAED
jgi:hypothetical protein